jgi:hypothetical protein
MSYEGVTSLGVVFVNICKESRKDLNKFFATGIRLLVVFRLEAPFPVCEWVTLLLEGCRRRGNIARGRIDEEEAASAAEEEPTPLPWS